jgi:hypothetical protein
MGKDAKQLGRMQGNWEPTSIVGTQPGTNLRIYRVIASVSMLYFGGGETTLQDEQPNCNAHRFKMLYFISR